MFIVTACAWSASARAIERPNILLILADDVGREVLGCYGGTSYPTPNLDRLAAGGTRFTHAYAMPLCHPTRTTLLSGQYPFRMRHPRWGTYPPPAESNTIAHAVRRAGYATVVAGKWQLALLKDDLEQPRRMGFDEYCLHGWHEGPWYYQPHIWENGRLRNDVRHRYGPDVVMDYLIDFMSRHRERPFFAWHSMSLCHAETNDLAAPAPKGPLGRYENYAEMAARMDRAIGRVVAAVEELGLRERTIIIFYSDNGTAQRNLIDAREGRYVYEPVVSELQGRPVAGGKGTLTERGTGVPLIVNWPGRIAAGTLSDALVDASDFLPTLAAAAGASLPEGVVLDGRRIGPLTGMPEASPRPWVFAECKGEFFVRNHRWKLYSDGRLFDMIADAAERQPLRDEAAPAEAAAARLELQEALDELGVDEVDWSRSREAG